ncbi:MAG: hypothetical protein ACKVX7_11675 [Planctomycetota bacterium]
MLSAIRLRMWSCVALFLMFGMTVARGQTVSIPDPLGDTVDGLGSGPRLMDLSEVQVTPTPLGLDVVMSFYNGILPPELLAPTSVVAVFDLDVDRDASTGGVSLQGTFPGFTILDLGIERRVLNFGVFAGSADVVDADFNFVGSISIDYMTTSLSFSVPFTLLGGGEDGVNFTAIAGTIDQPTDALGVFGTTAITQLPFLRGECNANGVLDIGDPIFHLNQIMSVGEKLPCDAACDSNDDQILDMSDPVYLLQHLFLAGPPPPAPYPGCDIAPVETELSCNAYLGCD